MAWNPIEYLKKLHTRQLLNLRNRIYRVSGGYWYKPENKMVYDVSENHQGMIVSLKQVKAELATREHVPNKKEAKALRQQRAKEGR